MTMTLESLRQKIDGIDGEIVRLLNLRVEQAIAIGADKKKHGLAIRDRAREEAILESLVSANPGPLDDDALRTIYRDIFEACVEAEKRSVDEPRGDA